MSCSPKILSGLPRDPVRLAQYLSQHNPFTHMAELVEIGENTATATIVGTSSTITIPLPEPFRRETWDDQTIDGITYNYVEPGVRTATDGDGNVVTQRILPAPTVNMYFPIFWPPNGGGPNPTGVPGPPFLPPMMPYPPGGGTWYPQQPFPDPEPDDDYDEVTVAVPPITVEIDSETCEVVLTYTEKVLRFPMGLGVLIEDPPEEEE